MRDSYILLVFALFLACVDSDTLSEATEPSSQDGLRGRLTLEASSRFRFQV